MKQEEGVYPPKSGLVYPKVCFTQKEALLSLLVCVTFDKLIGLSEPPFSYLKDVQVE